MAIQCYLATYCPLIVNPPGRAAAKRHGLPGYIDGSCRREPDFQSAFPSITATCLGPDFARKLQVGDRVAYLTVKRVYPSDSLSGWRLAAVLQVVERFESHGAAAQWYQAKGLSLPSNCIVPGNPPQPFRLTNGIPPEAVRSRVAAQVDPEKAIRLWDATYQGRIAESPAFLACKPEFLEISAPPQLRESDLTTIFGEIPDMVNPSAILRLQFDRLLKTALNRCVYGRTRGF